jgi:DNA sulfur modification protein DndD
MIMDSPFGSLDPAYQERISAMLPEMAQQVVVLVTDSQWSEEVKGEMARVAGAEYSLEYYDPENDNVQYEWTEIVRTGGVA